MYLNVFFYAKTPHTARVIVSHYALEWIRFAVKSVGNFAVKELRSLLVWFGSSHSFATPLGRTRDHPDDWTVISGTSGFDD